MKKKPKYVAQVTPLADGGFLGEVVEEGTGKPAGFSSRTKSATEAAAAVLDAADAGNAFDIRYDKEEDA